MSLVRTANMLPVMLLALAGGGLDDQQQPAPIEGVVQASFFSIGLLLVATFALGAGVALQQPSIQAGSDQRQPVQAVLSIGSVLAVIYGLKQSVQDGVSWLPVLSMPAAGAAIVGPMLSPLLAQRVGVRQVLAGLLATAAVGFAVQAVLAGPLAVLMVAIGWMLWALGGSAAATLTTDRIIGTARPERAGAVSAVAQAGAELGGALGIAVLGSLGTAIYCGAVASAMPQGLSADAAAAARETLGGALSVARGLTDPAAAATLVLAAQHGLTTAVQVTSAIGAVISILTALAVLVHFDAAGEQVCADERRANSCPALSSPGTYQ